MPTDTTRAASRLVIEHDFALTDALRFIEGLLKVAPEHRDRMQRWEHGDFNDTDNTAALAGTDRTILIGQMDAAATAIEELRHSPHLWAAANPEREDAGTLEQALERERGLRDERVRTAQFHVAHDGTVQHPDTCSGCRAQAERNRRGETPNVD